MTTEGMPMLTALLGANIGEMLAVPPFSQWEVTRSTEEESPEKRVWYEFNGRGVEVICDASDRIRTIFLHRGHGASLSEIPFSLSRRGVLARYGAPSKSGDARKSVLGERGAWDRFESPSYCVHFQYRADRDEIDMITLMRPDAVP